MTKEGVLAFIKSKKLTVISTIGVKGWPESAIIAFGETDEFELIFGTSRMSRKYQNLQANNKVAFVIGFGNEGASVQYEGFANEVAAETIEEDLAAFHAKVPGAVAYHSDPNQTYWKVTPTWIRFTDLSGDEEQIFEFSF